MATAHPLPAVFDGHNDVLHRLHRLDLDPGPAGFLQGDGEGDVDLPRARAANFAGGFFAVFAPSPERERVAPRWRGDGYEAPLPPALNPAAAREDVLALVARMARIERASAGAVRIVRSGAELRTCLDDGRLAVVLHLEGADAIDPALELLEVLHAAGLRSLGPVWSRPNRFGHGVPFRYPSSPDTGPGLTADGLRLLDACNELGIVFDLAHLNERGFWDVAGRSRAPLVATHTAAHAICHSSRNLTDAQIDAIGASEGMIGLNFNVRDVRPDGRTDEDTPLEDLVRQIDYLVDRIGIDRVGFGSDFDGATMPRAIGDVSGVPRLLEALRARGYDPAALARLAHGNWLRLLETTWGLASPSALP